MTADPDSSPARTTTVFLVDDDCVHARVILESLRASTDPRYVVVTVNCLADALERISGGSFDVVLFELELPDSHGIATFEAVQRAAPFVPVIVFTIPGDDAKPVRLLQSGAQDYLVKGEVDGPATMRAIRYAISRSDCAAEVRRLNLERIDGLEKQKAIEVSRAAIIESAPDGIIVIDQSGLVLEFNPAAVRMFGFRREEAMGRELAELIIPPASRDPHRKGLAHYLAPGEGPVLTRRLEVVAQRADGSECPVELTIASSKSVAWSRRRMFRPVVPA